MKAIYFNCHDCYVHELLKSVYILYTNQYNSKNTKELDTLDKFNPQGSFKYIYI